MYIVIINNQDASCHTLEADALVQKQRFIDSGYANVLVVEKETFNPPVVD